MLHHPLNSSIKIFEKQKKDSIFAHYLKGLSLLIQAHSSAILHIVELFFCATSTKMAFVGI